MMGSNKDKARWCPETREEAMGTNLKKKICLNTRNHIFTVMVGKYCKRFPREVVESPSLEILKTLLAMALDNLL